jgi:hypothetical protein
VATPAAGAEWSYTPDDAAIHRILSIRYRFTTSIAVANRQPALTADDGTTIWWQTGPILSHVAGAQVRYVGFVGCQSVFVGQGVEHLIWPSEGVVLQQGWALRSLTAGIDVADQYDQITMLVEDLPSGPDLFIAPSGVVYTEPLDG